MVLVRENWSMRLKLERGLLFWFVRPSRTVRANSGKNNINSDGDTIKNIVTSNHLHLLVRFGCHFNCKKLLE